MGLMFRPRRPLMRVAAGAATATVAYKAGQRRIHSGPLVVDEDVVIDPTGGRFTLRGVTVADFEGDRIRAFRQYWDEASLLEQLQLLPTE